MKLAACMEQIQCGCKTKAECIAVATKCSCLKLMSETQ